MFKPITLLALLPLFTACEVDDDVVHCTAEEVASVSVSLTQSNGQVVEDGVVTYSVDGGEVKDCEGTGDTFICGSEEDGEFTLTATASMTSTETVTVTVSADECHPITESLTIDLVAWDE